MIWHWMEALNWKYKRSAIFLLQMKQPKDSLLLLRSGSRIFDPDFA
jgi:hypothetical protein